MSNLRPRKRPHRTALAVVPLALVVGLAGTLAWTAVTADRAQRQAARGTVQDYADFAAFLMLSEAQRRMEEALFYTFYREDLAWRTSGVAVEPSVLASDPQESRRCGLDGDGVPWVLRLSTDTLAVAVHGELDPVARTWLADTLAALSREAGPGDLRTGHLRDERLAPDGIAAFRIRSDTADGGKTAAYALASCFQDRSGPILPAALAARPLLPPTLVGDLPTDSLLTATLLAPRSDAERRDAAAGAVRGVALDGEAFPFQGVASDGEAGPFGGSRLTVAFRPPTADLLLRGRAPLYSRAPLAIGLLAATVVLTAIAALLLLRSIRLVRLRERFVADVSHELRTPLQQVLLFSQLLRAGEARSAEESSRFLSIIEREALRLIALVERVLAFARPSAASPPVVSPPVSGSSTGADVARVARDAVARYAPIVEGRSQTVRLDAPSEARAAISSDGAHQILLNLLDNASKYGPEGQCIDVRVRNSEGVILEVEDRGPGIPTADRERIWEPFFRLEREQELARAGSGIGLAVVREIADRFGATAEIEDGAAGGVVFRVRMRAARP